MLDPMQRALDVSGALRAMQLLSQSAGTDNIKVEGNGLCTIFRLLANELEEATMDMLMSPSRPA